MHRINAIRRPLAVGVAVLVAAAAGLGSVPTAGADPGCRRLGTVSDAGDDGGPDQLRAQIADACSGGIVQIVPGTVVLAEGALVLTRDVEIRGLGPDAAPTVIDAHHNSRVFEVTSAHVTLSNLTVAGGQTSGNGGAILNTSGNLELHHATVTGSSAANSGGGVANFGTLAGAASLTLNDSTVTANAASFAGGGIANVARGGDAVLVLNDSVVTQNVASGPGTPFGGGILNSPALLPPAGGMVSVTLNGDSTVSANRSTYGGGIFNNGDATSATVTIKDAASVADNVSTLQGGGVMNFARNGGSAVVSLGDDAAIRGNHANGRGGGMFNEGTLDLHDRSTVAGNSASFDGGGVFNLSVTAAASITLHDESAIRDNTAGTTGGGISNVQASFPTSVTLLDHGTVTANHPNNCSGTPAC